MVNHLLILNLKYAFNTGLYLIKNIYNMNMIARNSIVIEDNFELNSGLQLILDESNDLSVFDRASYKSEFFDK